MKTQTNEVQAIYNNAIRAQGVGKPFFVVITEAAPAEMRERAKLDIKNSAQAAGVEMLKTARIAVRRGMRQQQYAGIKELNEMLREIRETSNRSEAIKWGMIATGYANGMHCGELISKSELHDVLQVIDQIYKKAELRIETANRHFWLRIIRKWVRV